MRLSRSFPGQDKPLLMMHAQPVNAGPQNRKNCVFLGSMQVLETGITVIVCPAEEEDVKCSCGLDTNSSTEIQISRRFVMFRKGPGDLARHSKHRGA